MDPHVRVQHSAAGGWEFAVPAPGSPSAFGAVCGYREWGAPVRRRELPHDGYTLVLSFGDPIVVGADRYTSFLAGLHDRPVLTTHDGAQHGVEILVSPAVARALLRRPLDQLTNAVVALPDLLGPDADRLAGQLASAEGWAARFALLDTRLAARIADAPPLSGEVRWALDVLTRRHGRIPVAQLADATGWSRRHFTSRFRTEVGMAPKAFARVLRFQRAYQRMRATPQERWARIAADAGYYDQPHLNREFRELAGLPPAALLAAAIPGAGTAA